MSNDLTKNTDQELQEIMRNSIDNSYVPSSIYNKARLELEIRAMNSNKKSDIKKDKKAKKTKKATVEEWLHFSWSYLELAEIACDYWNIRLKDIKNFEKNYPHFSQPTNVRSFLPLVFNIKHSLELFLKRIAVSFDHNINYSHDLKELSGYIVDLDWTMVRNKIKNLKSKGDGTIEVANKICSEKNLLESETNELISIIDNYYHIYPISEKISKNIVFHDTENTAFKYPENSLLVSFDYADLTEKITHEDFLKLKEDIKKTKKIYSDIGFVLRIYAEN